MKNQNSKEYEDGYQDGWKGKQYINPYTYGAKEYSEYFRGYQDARMEHDLQTYHQPINRPD